ncbi:MAG: L,D-transpeptidase family protein [Armatimonadota bacterium]
MSTHTFRRIVVYGVLAIAAGSLFSMRRVLWRRLVIGDTAVARTHTPTVEGALSAYGKRSDRRFRAVCRQSGVAYPPKRITLIALKEEKRLEVWGADARKPYKRLAVYPVLAASGVSGPKRREGDLQVPEGFYRISALNPASQFHLSLRVDYPNAEDTAHRTVARSAMGGDIYVHGGAASIGCLALGDSAIEEVFCLVARASAANRTILIAPRDFRVSPDAPRTSNPWVQNLYMRLQTTLREDFPL